MSNRREREKNWAHWIAVWAVVLLISAGLCGANGALFARYGAIGGPDDPNRPASISLFLMGMGLFELAGIGIGAVGLVVTLIALLSTWIASQLKRDRE